MEGMCWVLNLVKYFTKIIPSIDLFTKVIPFICIVWQLSHCIYDRAYGDACISIELHGSCGAGGAHPESIMHAYKSNKLILSH